MANINVEITNGSGSALMKKGSYSVTVAANGYEATTLSPSTYTATEYTGTGNFTVSANGVLTLIFNETGASGGTAVTSGSVVMTDSTGQTEYGSQVNINGSGEAVFNNVPYNDGTPYVLYFVQKTTDDGHNIFSGVITVNMSGSTQTQYVENLPIAEQSFTLTDANYTGLPVSAAAMTFTGE